MTTDPYAWYWYVSSFPTGVAPPDFYLAPRHPQDLIESYGLVSSLPYLDFSRDLFMVTEPSLAKVSTNFFCPVSPLDTDSFA